MDQEDSLVSPSAVRATAQDIAPDSQKKTLRLDLRQIAALLGMYIRADKFIAVLLIICQLVPTIASALVFMQMQLKLAAITNALVARDAAALPQLATMVVVFGIAGAAVSVFMQWTGYVLRIRFRTVLTRHYLDRWLAADRYYQLERRANLDHPEQRIQEDIYQFIDRLLTLAPMMLTSMTALVLYSGQLFKLSPPVNFGFVGIPHEIPGFLLYFALIMSIGWTAFTHWIGKALTRVEVVRQRLEALFRHQMSTVRENGESIAFARAAGAEQERLTSTFGLIRQNWRHYTVANLKIVFFGGVPETILTLTPPLLAAPYVLNGTMKVGDIALLNISLHQVYNAIGIIVALYPQLAIFRASVARLRLMDELLAVEPRSDITVVRAPENAIHIRDLSLGLPDGAPLARIGDMDIVPGKRLLVRGPSGVGKSTLLRSVAGLWPFGSGRVQVPEDARVAFLPQRAYMPEGTLASLMAFPEAASAHPDARYRELMERLGLGHLTGRLHDHAAWDQTLSGGEQQRVAAVRAILADPDYLFMDEATSALDAKSENTLYSLLVEQLDRAAIISVAHRESVSAFHTDILEIEPGRQARVAAAG